VSDSASKGCGFVIARHLTKEDVDLIMDNLWQQGREEVLIMGSSLEKMREKFKSMVNQPWSTAFVSDSAFAMIIMEPIGSMKWTTSFASTEEGFKKNWFPLTKFLRKVSDKIVNEYSGGNGIIELETTSEGDYNWFQSLGFELIETDGFIDRYIKEAR
jgi:hypothetical protein